jgi:hypothetical protein
MMPGVNYFKVRVYKYIIKYRYQVSYTIYVKVLQPAVTLQRSNTNISDSISSHTVFAVLNMCVQVRCVLLDAVQVCPLYMYVCLRVCCSLFICISTYTVCSTYVVNLPAYSISMLSLK